MAFGVSAISEGDRSIALGASRIHWANTQWPSAVIQKHWVIVYCYGGLFQSGRSKRHCPGNATKATEIMSIALGDTANASKRIQWRWEQVASHLKKTQLPGA